jgi:hypothetical protein
MMRVEIRRKWETPRSISGEMWIDGQFQCYTLEPARETPVHEGHPCIAAGGPFKVALTLSPHLLYVTPEVLNVPGRSHIRWHVGNRPEDVLGCVVVGETPQTDFVMNSRKAFAALMIVLKRAADGIEAIYLDPAPAPAETS